MNTKITYRFCAYISNQAYQFSKLNLKQRLKIFHQNPRAFKNKDKAALILTLQPRELISQELAKQITDNIDLKTIEHSELAILSNFLSLNQIKSQQMWTSFAQKGFQILEDFDRDSLPKFLDAIDRSEQAEIQQFWDAILKYARRNFHELNGECAISLFCNLIRRYPSLKMVQQAQTEQKQNENTQQIGNQNINEDNIQNNQELGQTNKQNETDLFDEEIDDTNRQSFESQQEKEINEKLEKSAELLQQSEEEKKQYKDEWELETNDIILDIYNQIVKKHLKSFNGNQILRFINYLIEYRPEWISMNGQNNLKIALVFLEEQINTIENLTFFLMTLMQTIERVSAQNTFFIKVIDYILQHKSQINAYNVHLVCALFEVLDIREQKIIWKNIIDVILNEHQKINSSYNQQIIISSLLNCRIIHSTSNAQQIPSFDKVIEQLSQQK